MLVSQLQRFASFASLDEPRLARVAANTRSLTLPANRWLIRPGRSLSGSYYLLRGRVRTHGPDGEFGEDDPRADQPIVPGALAIKTLAVTNLLVVDTVALGSTMDDASYADAPAELGLLLPQWLKPGWEHRFLRQNVVQPLGPAQWQRIFRGMQPRRYTAGEAVVEQGQAAADFYVLSGGVASVRRGNVEVARLAAGDFFGEDALVLDTARNATVTMMSAGAVMVISREVFLNEMLAKVLLMASQRPWDKSTWGPCPVPLRVGRGSNRVTLRDLRARAIGLDRTRRYLVAGDTPAEAALGTFLLLQAGHCATSELAQAGTVCQSGQANRLQELVQAGTVRPSAQARRARTDSARMTDMG